MNIYTNNTTTGFLAQEVTYVTDTAITNPNAISDRTEGAKFVNVASAKTAPNVYAHSIMDVMDVIGKDFFVTLNDYLFTEVADSVSLIDIIANAEARAVLLPKYDSGYDIEYFRQVVKYINYVMSMCNVDSLSQSAFGAISQLAFFEVGNQLQDSTNVTNAKTNTSTPPNPKHTSTSNVVYDGVAYTSTIEFDTADRVSTFL